MRGLGLRINPVIPRMDQSPLALNCQQQVGQVRLGDTKPPALQDALQRQFVRIRNHCSI